MKHSIFTALSPNVEHDDVALSFKLLLQPWKFRKGKGTEKIQNFFQSWLSVKHAFAFVSGRSALFALLSCLELEKDSEVLLQAYTCVAVPDPVLWARYTPRYVDVDPNTFNMSAKDLVKKITPRSRVLIIQHTFGKPADLEALLAIARTYNLFVIEDCAHALGVSYNGKKLGTFGDASFFSFGRDKVISSVFGGMLCLDDDALAVKVKKYMEHAVPAPILWIKKQLLHPILTSFIKSTYDIWIGKFMLHISKRLNIITKPVEEGEKSGHKPTFLLFAFPDVFAYVALHQLEKLEEFHHHRHMAALWYREALEDTQCILPSDSGNSHGYLRYTVRTTHARTIIQEGAKKGLYLGDWYTVPIAPQHVQYDAIRYTSSACPNAEKISHETLNLPTDIHITRQHVMEITQFLKKYI